MHIYGYKHCAECISIIFFRLFGKNYRHCVLALIICRHTIGPDVTLSHYKVKALIFFGT